MRENTAGALLTIGRWAALEATVKMTAGRRNMVNVISLKKVVYGKAKYASLFSCLNPVRKIETQTRVTKKKNMRERQQHIILQINEL
jgi:hypothetical protein